MLCTLCRLPAAVTHAQAISRPWPLATRTNLSRCVVNQRPRSCAADAFWFITMIPGCFCSLTSLSYPCTAVNWHTACKGMFTLCCCWKPQYATHRNNLHTPSQAAPAVPISPLQLKALSAYHDIWLCLRFYIRCAAGYILKMIARLPWLLGTRFSLEQGQQIKVQSARRQVSRTRLTLI